MNNTVYAYYTKPKKGTKKKKKIKRNHDILPNDEERESVSVNEEL